MRKVSKFLYFYEAIVSEILDIFDLLLAPLYLVFILVWVITVRDRNITKKPYYKYYLPAVICKLIGGVGMCIIYTFYYTEGGDSTNYFLAADTFVNAFLDLNWAVLERMLDFHDSNIHLSGFENYGYGMIAFSGSDYYALLTVVLTIPFCILGCKSFIAATLLLSYVSFLGLWRLYEVFYDHFPTMHKQFAIAIFFVPSVFFWGSGMLKDTFTLSALGFATYGIYAVLLQKKRNLKNILTLILSCMVLIFIKPYIFFAILPGGISWVFFNRITKINNPLLKTLIIPFMLTILVILIPFLLQVFGQFLGEYSMDNILEKAVKTQQDLVRSEQYGSNNFNIGSFEATVPGIASKIGPAINMALFRPYIWDARNPVMILAGLENLFLLGFSLFIFFKVKFTVLFRSLFSHPLLIFSFLFAIFFAFSVGLTTANYGALVRLRIPCIPFYLCSLYILMHFNNLRFSRK